MARTFALPKMGGLSSRAKAKESQRSLKVGKQQHVPIHRDKR